MGREHFTVTVVTPRRTLTQEILNEIHEACGFEFEGDIDFGIAESDGNGLSTFYLENIYDDDKIHEVISKHNIAASLEVSATIESAGYHVLYTPTTSSIDPGIFKQVTLDYYAEDYITVSKLNELFTPYGNDPTKMTKEDCEKLITNLQTMITHHSKDPHNIVEHYTYETALGRDKEKRTEINDVLSMLDRGIITEHEAMEEIKTIKER